MQLLESKQLVDRLLLTTKGDATSLIDKGIDPQLAVVMVGNNPDSARYVGMKSKRAKEVGIILSLYHMLEETSFTEIQESLAFLAQDVDVDGIILQLPLPERFTLEETNALISCIPEGKDIDGLNNYWLKSLNKDLPITIEALLAYTAASLPPMVCSVISLLDQYAISLADKKIVLIGEGRLVGRPLAAYLTALNLDVTTVNEETENILSITKQADLVISGTGQKDLITYQWVKEGATVIDCAFDVHTDSVEQVAGALAPAIGGVGPLTVVWLLHNTIQAARVKEGAFYE